MTVSTPSTPSISTDLWDDPQKDFRQRYKVPEHFLWGPYDPRMIDYLGYLRCCFKLLPPAPQQLLDVGCGDGWVAQQLLDRGYNVTGIDYSERAIGFARLLVEEGTFHVGDIRELKKRADWQEKFEVALFVEVLEHIPPQYHVDVMRSIGQTLHVGGILVLTVPSVQMPMNQWHYKHFTRPEIIELVESCGFEVEEIINQHRMSWLDRRKVWRLIDNPIIDLVFVRRWMRHLMLTRYNETDDPNAAGRFVVRARRVKQG